MLNPLLQNIKETISERDKKMNEIVSKIVLVDAMLALKILEFTVKTKDPYIKIFKNPGVLFDTQDLEKGVVINFLGELQKFFAKLENDKSHIKALIDDTRKQQSVLLNIEIEQRQQELDRINAKLYKRGLPEKSDDSHQLGTEIITPQEIVPDTILKNYEKLGFSIFPQDEEESTIILSSKNGNGFELGVSQAPKIDIIIEAIAKLGGSVGEKSYTETLDKTRMRTFPYNILYVSIGGIQKTILVSDEIGQATFIYNGVVERGLFKNVSKGNQIEDIQVSQINYSENFLQRVTECLQNQELFGYVNSEKQEKNISPNKRETTFTLFTCNIPPESVEEMNLILPFQKSANKAFGNIFKSLEENSDGIRKEFVQSFLQQWIVYKFNNSENESTIGLNLLKGELYKENLSKYDVVNNKFLESSEFDEALQILCQSKARQLQGKTYKTILGNMESFALYGEKYANIFLENILLSRDLDFFSEIIHNLHKSGADVGKFLNEDMTSHPLHTFLLESYQHDDMSNIEKIFQLYLYIPGNWQLVLKKLIKQKLMNSPFRSFIKVIYILSSSGVDVRKFLNEDMRGYPFLTFFSEPHKEEDIIDMENIFRRNGYIPDELKSYLDNKIKENLETNDLNAFVKNIGIIQELDYFNYKDHFFLGHNYDTQIGNMLEKHIGLVEFKDIEKIFQVCNFSREYKEKHIEEYLLNNLLDSKVTDSFVENIKNIFEGYYSSQSEVQEIVKKWILGNKNTMNIKNIINLIFTFPFVFNALSKEEFNEFFLENLENELMYGSEILFLQDLKSRKYDNFLKYHLKKIQDDGKQEFLRHYLIMELEKLIENENLEDGKVLLEFMYQLEPKVVNFIASLNSEFTGKLMNIFINFPQNDHYLFKKLGFTERNENVNKYQGKYFRDHIFGGIRKELLENDNQGLKEALHEFLSVMDYQVIKYIMVTEKLKEYCETIDFLEFFTPIFLQKTDEGDTQTLEFLLRYFPSFQQHLESLSFEPLISMFFKKTFSGDSGTTGFLLKYFPELKCHMEVLGGMNLFISEISKNLQNNDIDFIIELYKKELHLKSYFHSDEFLVILMDYLIGNKSALDQKKINSIIEVFLKQYQNSQMTKYQDFFKELILDRLSMKDFGFITLIYNNLAFMRDFISETEFQENLLDTLYSCHLDKEFQNEILAVRGKIPFIKEKMDKDGRFFLHLCAILFAQKNISGLIDYISFNKQTDFDISMFHQEPYSTVLQKYFIENLNDAEIVDHMIELGILKDNYIGQVAQKYPSIKELLI